MTGPRDIARTLLDIGAVNLRPERPFRLTSGKPSPVYVDCRRVISFVAERRAIIAAAVAHIEASIGRANIDAVAGGETAGIAYAAWISEALGLPMLYVRKQPKGFGRMAQIEGAFAEGGRVLLVEDMTTDAGSKLNFVAALRQAGAKVRDCFVVFRYGDEAVSRMAAIDVRLLSLASWADIIDEARTSKRLGDRAIAEIEAFLADPGAWQAAHPLAPA